MGKTLTADTSSIADDNGLSNAVFTHQWVSSMDGTDTNISGATGSTYKITSGTAGTAFKVTVAFTDDDGHSESLTSAPTAALESSEGQEGDRIARGAGDAAGELTIEGAEQVVTELAANTDDITDTDGLNNVSYTYQWIRVDDDGTSNPVNIGSDSENYTLVAADAGKKIKLRVDFTDDATNSETLTSGNTTVVVPDAMENCTPAGTVWCTTVTVGYETPFYNADDDIYEFYLGYAVGFGDDEEDFGELGMGDQTFTHRGIDYTVTGIISYYDNPELYIATTPDLPADGAGLTLHLQRITGDELELPLSAANLQEYGNLDEKVWYFGHVLTPTPEDPHIPLMRGYSRTNDPYREESDEGTKFGIRLSAPAVPTADDITLDFDSTTGTLDTDLTGSKGDYTIGGIHMDDSHVYVAIKAPSARRGIYKFDRSNGNINAKTTLSYDPAGLAGTSTRLYVHSPAGNGGAVEGYTLELANSNSDDDNWNCCTGGNRPTAYHVGDVHTSGSTSYYTYTLSERQVFPDSTRQGPRLRTEKVGADDFGFSVSGVVLEAAGVTLDNIVDRDHATDGSMWFIENGDGSGAFAFEITSGSFPTGVRSGFSDVSFGSNDHDGLFFDGTNLWSIDLNTLNVTDDTLTLKAFTPGEAPVRVVPETVTDTAVRFKRAVSMYDGPNPDDAHFGDVTLNLTGIGETTLLSKEGAIPRGIWGDSRFLWITDSRTKRLFRFNREQITDTGDRSFVTALTPDDFQHTPALWNYRSPAAVYHDDTTLWVADDSTEYLVAWDLGTMTRQENKDIWLGFLECSHIARGLWGNGTHLWASVIPAGNLSNGECDGRKVLRFDLATKEVVKPAGFEFPNVEVRDIWSGATTMWMHGDTKIYAYALEGGARTPALDICSASTRNAGCVDYSCRFTSCS